MLIVFVIIDSPRALIDTYLYLRLLHFGDEDGIMAGTLLGRVEYYDSSKEEWTQYVERLEHFFAANGVDTDANKLSAFLAVIGPAVYKVLRKLLWHLQSQEKSRTKTWLTS